MYKKSIISILLLFLSWSSFAQQYAFSTYSIEQGLSQSVVNCIFQDSEGFIWIGTQHGLNKFNGYAFEAYTFNPADTSSISNNWVYSVDENKRGNLLVVTKGGLNEFNKITKTFKRIHLTSGDRVNGNENAYSAIFSREGKWYINMAPALVMADSGMKVFKRHESKLEYDGSVKDNNIPLLEDKEGMIWMGSTRGLACFNPATGNFDYFFYDPRDLNSISNNNITALSEDIAGNIWIGTSNGLNMYSKQDRTFKKYFHNEKDRWALSNNFIRAVTVDKSGYVWIGTEGGGLNKLIRTDINQPVFEVFNSEKNALSHNIVNALMIDRSQNLWIGTLQGLSKTDLKKQKFRLYRKSDTPYTVDLLGNVIAAIFKDDNGKIWLGNWGQGLNILDRQTGQVRHFSSKLSGHLNLLNDFVHCIFKDSDKTIWLGTRDGLLIYKKENDSFVRGKDFYRSPALPDLRGIRINKIIQDGKKNYWLATQNGVYMFNLSDHSSERFFLEADEQHKLSGNLVYCIAEDHQGVIWIATLNGLDAYDPKTKKMSHFRKVNGAKNSPSDNFVISLCVDCKGDIWIGTGSGVNVFVKKDSSFLYYSNVEGLPDNQVFEILEDNNKNLWFATGHGLSRYDRAGNTFRTYTVEEGLQSLEFNLRAAFKSGDGEMFFGGMNGFNSFYPDSLNDNSYVPNICFTSFVKTNSNGENKKIDPDNLQEIVLGYDDYSFTMEFVALEFTNPAKNRYAYMMEGIADKWIDIGNRRFVPFSNLPPGNYTFRVKGCNNDGVWNEEGKSIRIIIKPPWYKSSLAYFVYIVDLILILFFFIKWRLRRLVTEKNLLEGKVLERTRQIETQKDKLLKSQAELDVINKELEQRVESRTFEFLKAKEKAESGDRLKTAFMHNISHEIRTPLNGILGSGQMMIDEDLDPEDRRKYFDVMQRSSQRLLNTITDYMDISLLASGNMDVEKKRFGLTPVLNEIYEKYSTSARFKNLELLLKLPPGTGNLQIATDQELLVKAVGHLLDNAIKFTSDGTVEFGYEMRGEELKFFVKDTGVGIAEEDQEMIFNHFSQAGLANNGFHEGNGLGLSIAKGIVQLLGGRIWLMSELNYGSTLNFTIPAELKYSEDEGIAEAINSIQKIPLILIAEDEESNSLLLAQMLEKEKLDILLVANGREAVEVCRKNPRVSLVIMDMKMPVMNGYEATTLIKTFAPDLPILAITAHALTGAKKKAIDAGCDDYLAKPILREELLEKLRKFNVFA